jgi:hypothetical protein
MKFVKDRPDEGKNPLQEKALNLVMKNKKFTDTRLEIWPMN